MMRTLAWFFLAGLAFGSPARAVVDAQMGDSEWFQNADHKLLVLEFDSLMDGDSGRQLAQLIGRMTLATIRGVPNVAIITLRQREQPAELTISNIREMARRQRTPVVVWGAIYEQKGRLLISSHLRLVPEVLPDREAFQWSYEVDALKGGARSAVAGIPTRQVNFTPIEISRQSLEELERLWSRTLVLRAEPNPDAPQTGELRQDEPYFVSDSSGEWSRLATPRSESGWVRLATLADDPAFHPLAGLVLYAQGLLQYLAGNYGGAVNTFTGYLDQHGRGQDPMNLAMARVLRGVSQLKLVSSGGIGQLSEAAADFLEASRLLPNAASPVNCRLLTLVAKAQAASLQAEEVKELERDLVRVIQTENDVNAVRNLQLLYEWPPTREVFRRTTPRFEALQARQLRLLKDLEVKLASPPAD